jgi:hypothetical protein
VAIRNSEDDLSLTRLAELPKESFQSNSRGCLRVFSILFDDIYSTFRKYNVAMRVRRAVRDSEFVHDGSPVFALHLFFLDVDEFDVVLHTDTATGQANSGPIIWIGPTAFHRLSVPFTLEISTLRPGRISYRIPPRGSYLAEKKRELLAIRVPLFVLRRQEDDMIIFVLTYAVLALLGLSLVGSMSAQIPKPSAKARFQPMPSTSRAVPVR